MEKFQASQCAKIMLIALLLLITPFLSSWMRPPYLYFLFNLLIIALGAESGILAAISKPPEDKKPAAPVYPVGNDTVPNKAFDGVSKIAPSGTNEVPMTVADKAAVAEKNKLGVKLVQKLNKCPSTPSLFFIGGIEGDQEYEESQEEAEEEEELGGQELFAKAETFIGNFYKQLKIQREESWKRIHGLYHKAF